MKWFTWNEEKNETLRRERGLSFEQVVAAVQRGELLDVLEHPDPERYPGQRIMVVRIDDYAHAVPFVDSDEHVFLKTIIPAAGSPGAMGARRIEMPDLDKHEHALLKSLERDEWRSVADVEGERGRLREAADATSRKDERVNIRLSRRDLEAVRARAIEEGIPYQTLIASVLHKYLAGKLVDRRPPGVEP